MKLIAIAHLYFVDRPAIARALEKNELCLKFELK